MCSLRLNNVQCRYLSVLIRDHVMHPNTSFNSVNEHLLVILYSIIINAMQIEHSSQFVKARQPRRVGLVVYIMQNLRLNRRPSQIIFARIVRPMNVLQLCR